MKKAEKKAEKEADTDICDEGEPSRHMSSDHENQETFEGIPDVRSSSLINDNRNFANKVLALKFKPFYMKHAENLYLFYRWVILCQK